MSKKDKKDDFRELISNCIKAYEKLNNDSLALDLCKVSDKKLRSMILADEEYQRETKAIYARQRLSEIEELEHLSSLAVIEEEEEEEKEGKEFLHPEDRGKKPEKKRELTSVDRDMLNMRFKAAQLRRELMAEMAKSANSGELDTIYLFYVDTSVEEFMKLQTFELHEGTDEADIDTLLGTKEEIPIGTSGKTRVKSKNKKINDEDDFEILENGEIVER